jgi:hypothetical protein
MNFLSSVYADIVTGRETWRVVGFLATCAFGVGILWGAI